MAHRAAAAAGRLQERVLRRRAVADLQTIRVDNALKNDRIGSCGKREADVLKLDQRILCLFVVHLPDYLASNRLLLNRSCESSHVRERSNPVEPASSAMPAMSYLYEFSV